MSPVTPYISLLVIFAVAILLAGIIPVLSGMLGPKRPSEVKSQAFEGGNPPLGNARQRFAVKFYVVALLFIVFDIEAVFLYPWAVNLQTLGWFGYAAISIFALTLFAALVYIWKKGALDWES